MIEALHRLQNLTGGFGGFLVLAGDWADREATLRSYELMGRYVIPEFRGHMEPLRASYDMVVAKKRDYGARRWLRSKRPTRTPASRCPRTSIPPTCGRRGPTGCRCTTA